MFSLVLGFGSIILNMTFDSLSHVNQHLSSSYNDNTKAVVLL